MRKWIGSWIALGLLLTAGSAGAVTIGLSSVSSDSTSPDLLDAQFDYVVVGTQLRLTVHNLTGGSNSFDMVSIFFNDTNDVVHIDFTGVQGSNDGWVFHDTGKFLSNALGTFDYSLHSPVWRNANLEGVAPGQVVTFLFNITCAGTLTCDANDFATAPSVGGSNPVISGARFIRGPENATPFGGGSQLVQVPEPTTALLLGAGLLGLASAGRRRR